MRWYFSRAEQYAVAVLLVAVVGALVVLGYAYGARSIMQAANGPLYTPQRQSSSSNSSETISSVTVHVTGAVVHGGTYTLDSNARINDALQAAGGPTEDGCPEAMNLAAHLQDGQKISLPTRAEWEKTIAKTPPPLVENEQPRSTASAGGGATAETPAEVGGEAASTSGNKPAAPAKVAGDEKININTASYEELQRLPRVGPVMAQAIVDYRAKNGPITDYAQLLNIPRLGEKTLENLKPHITL